ncbi:Protein of unknown function [Cotesia congregata]|uniref:Uncharacterized protein n=1 Tax=Cotesia congregata TaxID=51543 RepID=A0A8J2HKH8_COTCN|nr:Protein of unknown function [Cotesia congregata]
MDEEDRNNEIKNFVSEMLKTFNSFNETDNYKSTFPWDEFDKKLRDHRMNKNNSLSLLPHIIFQDLRLELNILESLIHRFFKNKVSSHIDDIQNLCSFPLSHTISQSKLTYSYIEESYKALTGEIERREAKSETTDVDCDEHLFLQDLYELSKEILRGFVLKFFRSSIGLSLKSKCTVESEENVKKKLLHQRNHFMNNVTMFMNFTRNYLGNFSEYLYACDFSNHTRDKTYIELERMYQVMIENEFYLDKDGSCSYNCNTKGEHFKPHVDYMCKDLDCQYMGAKFEICQLDDDVRRYQWFKDGNNNVYGNNTNCSGKMVTYNSWYQWTTRYCDYCLCVCTAKLHREVHNEITAISFQDQVSDTDSSKVVLDLKFVIKNNTIYVEIKEGKLLPHGKIDNNSVAWKALDNCTIFDNFTFCTYPPLNGLAYGLTTAVKDFGYPEYLNLDDIKASTESIVTGVRFRFAGDFNTHPRYKNGSVEMQIRLTDFDYLTGKLSKNHVWISSNNKQNKTELLLPNPDNPIKSPKNIPNLKGNQFVKFKVSDLKKDAGQSTVPFFDARPVESKVLFPLKGIGLFHRGYEGFGGFIAFKLFIISPQEYMNTDLGVTNSVTPASINTDWNIFSGLNWP